MLFPSSFNYLFEENYLSENSKLANIYRGAQAAHWDAATAIDWTQQIDPQNPLGYDDRFIPIWNGRQWQQSNDAGREELRRTYHAYSVSQFLHGEQIAMLAAGKLVMALPHVQSKQFAAVQAADEARHVEVFDRLLTEKFDTRYPIDNGLTHLMGQGLSDTKWDMVVLTTQVLIEGFALVALTQLRSFSKHQLIRDISELVLADEARHVAFGMQHLKALYTELTDAELVERREFASAGVAALLDNMSPIGLWDEQIESPNLVLLKKHATRKVKAMLDTLFERLA